MSEPVGDQSPPPYGAPSSPPYGAPSSPPYGTAPPPPYGAPPPPPYGAPSPPPYGAPPPTIGSAPTATAAGSADSYPYPGMAALPAPHRVNAASWIDSGDVRFGAVLVAGLAALGVITGLLWSAISPHSHGFVVPGVGVIPDEAEGFVAADGRFALLTGGIGLLTGLLVWLHRGRRGPVTAAAVGIGVLVASALAALVGHAVSSGRSTGPANTSITLPITVHAHGLIPLGAALALLVYVAGALVARPDDLGRPDPAPAANGPAPATAPSGLGYQPDGGYQPAPTGWPPPPATPGASSPPAEPGAWFPPPASGDDAPPSSGR